MKEFILFTTIIVIILSLIFYWERYKYKECINVGHSKTYCILKINS